MSQRSTVAVQARSLLDDGCDAVMICCTLLASLSLSSALAGASAFVHGTRNVPSTESTFEGPLRHSRNPVSLDTPRGPVDGAVTSSAFGIELVTVRHQGICGTLQVGSVTSIDEETVLIRKSFTQLRVDGENPSGGVAEAILRNVVGQLEQDIPIGESKAYYEHPS